MMKKLHLIIAVLAATCSTLMAASFETIATYRVPSLLNPQVDVKSDDNTQGTRYVIVSNITLDMMNQTLLKKDMTRWQNDYSSYGQSKYLRLKPDAISQFRSVFVKVFDGYFTKEDSHRLDSLKKAGNERRHYLEISMVIDDQGGIDQLELFYSYNPNTFADIDHKKLLELLEELSKLKLVYHLPNDCLKIFATFSISLTALRDNRLVPDSRNTRMSR